MSQAKHSYSEAEKAGLVDFINSELNANINPKTEEIFERIKDGVLLGKLMETIQPGLVGKMNADPSGDPKTVLFKQLQNQGIVLEAAKKLGCSIVNVGGQDLASGTPHLVLGVLWQVVRVGLLKKVSSLFGDTLGLPPEQLLLRWFNYHLTKAGHKHVVANFSTDLQNSEALTVLLHQLSPNQCDLLALDEKDLTKRGENVLSNADKIGCKKFITAQDIVKANGRLLLAFVAILFIKFPDMGEKDEIEVLKKRIEQLENENKTLILTHQLQVKQINEEFTKRILSLETEFGEERKLAEEHQMKIVQLENENRELLGNHQRELEQLHTEFDQKLKQMRDQMLLEKEEELKKQQDEDRGREEIIKKTCKR